MSHNKHRNSDNAIFGQPEITKLYNGRYRLSFRCLRDDNNTGWYYDNIGDIFAEFGDASNLPYAAQGKEVTAPIGSVWPDMKLIRHGWEYSPQQPIPFLTFVYETLTDSYVQDRDDKVDFDLNGLRRVTRTLIAEEGTSYGKIVGTDSLSHTALGYGTETLYLASVSEDPKGDGEGGFTRIQEVWLEPGVLREAVRINEDGTREVSISSWYTKPTPDGIVTDTVNENVEGFDVWTVSAVQSLSGGDPTSGTALEYEAYVQFTYPGIAEAVKEILAGGRPAVNTRLKSPITADVLADVSITYSDSGDVGTLPYTYWNPTEWAFMTANWLTARGGTANEPTSRYQALVGYRTGPEDEQTLENPAGVQQAFFNQFCYGGTVTIEGGPEDPVGNTYVIAPPNPEPAFVGEDGTQYYRQTIVTATIPAQ